MEDLPVVWGYNYPAKRDDLPGYKQKILATFVTRISKNMVATYSRAMWCSTTSHEGLNYST
jgi:hypothetical protein